MSTTLQVRDHRGVRTVAHFPEAGAPGPWLIVVPHDDDLMIGMGLAVQEAVREGIAVWVAVVSDGRMGYAEPAERATIVARRRIEMAASCRCLGIDASRVQDLGFPDSDLASWRGRRVGADGAMTGIAHALTRTIRAIAPGSIFGPTRADLHPDHVVVAEELAIACFHASGEIWLELGPPVALPSRWDYAVYCPFPGEPTLQVLSDAPPFEAKLASIAAFASQRQIHAIVQAQRSAGAQEYLQLAAWTAYAPERYRDLFTPAARAAMPPSTPASAAPSQTTPGAAFARDCARCEPLLNTWDARAWAPLVAAFRRSREQPVLLLGEGSSRLFPAALAVALARLAPERVRVEHLGGREALGVAFGSYQPLLVSNSGRTRELVELAEPLRAASEVLAVVGVGGGPVMRLAAQTRVLLSQPEEAVAATVSVLAQALTIAHALCEAAELDVPWTALRAAVAAGAQARLPADLGKVHRVWWSGPECGPAGELALKTMETAGCMGVHLPGSMALHGIEEVLEVGDLVVALEPDTRDLPSMQTRLGGTGARLLVVSAEGDVRLPELGWWSGFGHLAAGWQLLAQLAARLGRDPDRPRRARKVGNEALGSGR